MPYSLLFLTVFCIITTATSAVTHYLSVVVACFSSANTNLMLHGSSHQDILRGFRLIASIVAILIVSLSMPTAAATRLSEQVHIVPAWVKDAVFYQIFPERFANGDPSNDPKDAEQWGGIPTTRNYFGGDLQGIIDRLDYIASLGVNALYLNPIFESNSNHKYQTVDYMRIDPHFGDESTFRRLVDSCHARNIRIILDGVFNHTGVGFFAFADVKKNGAASKYKEWYNFHSFPVGPVSKPNYDCWWNYGSLPKLMTANPEVRKYLFDVTRKWMSFGIDGWRLDVPNEISHEFWEEWRSLVKSINPEAYIVGEIWDDAGSWLRGDQFDAVMNYRFRDACVKFFAEESIAVSEFDERLSRQRSDYTVDVNYALQNLLGSHDTERFLTLCKQDEQTTHLAWLFQMTYVGAPMVYYGDELGMTGGKDPECRGTMVWDEMKQNKTMLTTMQQLARMRNQYACLRRGEFQSILVDDTQRIYAFARTYGTEIGVVVINNDTVAKEVALPLNTADELRSWEQVWPTNQKIQTYKRKSLIISVPAKAGVVCIGGDSE
ncbi:MAG: glycoside hydrolase family 13 protein [Bacteroidota bacterium]